MPNLDFHILAITQQRAKGDSRYSVSLIRLRHIYQTWFFLFGKHLSVSGFFLGGGRHKVDSPQTLLPQFFFPVGREHATEFIVGKYKKGGPSPIWQTGVSGWRWREKEENKKTQGHYLTV